MIVCTLLGLLIMLAASALVFGFGYLLNYLAGKYGDWLATTILVTPVVLFGAYLIGLLLCEKP